MSRKVWAVKAKNISQQQAIDALIDPSIELVVLEGIAGSGKTLLALAAGLEQVIETKSYNEIIFTRAPIPVGDDMGFLPGTENDKMLPWCAALVDNLEQLVGNSKLTATIIETKIKMRAMCYMRGSSLYRRYVIIDEAQNITTQQLKVLLTRAGEGCKIVVMGDAEQIDNKKVNKDNNALTTLISRAGNKDFVRVIRLPEGVRSQLSKWAAETL